jgi:hypothetical protein
VKKMANRIMLKHKGVPTAELAREIVEYINEGYKMTIQDIANHLSVSYDYVRTKIVPEISHVVLTSYTRQACFKYYGDQDHLFDYFHKRLLISLPDYNRYLLENGVLIKRVQQLFIDDLSLEMREKYKSLSSKEANTWLNKQIVDCLPIRKKEEEEQIEPLKVYPENLKSNKDLINGAASPLYFNYDVDVARFISKYGVPKIKVNNIVGVRPRYV